MDIAAASIVMSQSQLAAQASIQVARTAMDSSAELSQGLLKMMEQSVQPHLGGTIDLKG